MRIEASFMTTRESQFQCDTTRTNLLEKMNGDNTLVDKAMRRRGCTGPLDEHSRNFKGELGEYAGCFCRYSDKMFPSIYRIYKHYEKTGNFPDGAALNDQANKLIEILDLIQTLETIKHNRDVEAQNRKNRASQ